MGERPNESKLSACHIRRACEESLRRLQTDHIDLYQLHRPAYSLPQDETLRAFDDLVRAGKVLHRRFHSPGLDGDGGTCDE
jgi:aryl-alcohol dehydrogenase-like predicted oxidoreductase